MNVNKSIFNCDYKYSKSLENLTNSHSFFKREIVSRCQAVALSALALLALAVKTVSGTISLLKSTGKSIIHRRNEFGNYRNNYTEVCEYIRYLFGTALGSIVGIIHPKTARSLFLSDTDKVLKKNLNKEEATTLYQAIALMNKLFEKYDIDYMPQGGTYLGMLRHDGIIPWDDDADFFLRPGDENKLQTKAFKNDLQKHGFELVPAYVNLGVSKERWGFKICYAKGTEKIEAGETVKFPFIDLMTTKKLKNGRITYDLDAARLAYPEEYFTQEEWDNREQYTFGPVQILGPKNAEPFCDRNFGANWKDIAVQQTIHNPKSRFKFQFTKKVKIETLGTGVEYDKEKVDAFVKKLEKEFRKKK